MVKPAYVLAAFAAMLVLLAILLAFIFVPDSSPFDHGASLSPG